MSDALAVVEPKAGHHFTRATPNRTALQFARVIGNLVAAYPTARTIHLVMASVALHRQDACQKVGCQTNVSKRSKT